MKNIVLATLAFLLLLFALTVWIVYSAKQPVAFLQQEQSQVIQKDKEKQEIRQEEWFYSMAKTQEGSFSYPTNEMILKYNFRQGQDFLRVFIDDLSEYRFYCINQILLENKIEYAYYKTDKVIQLVVFLNDKKIQKKILEDFDYYKIEYSLR